MPAKEKKLRIDNVGKRFGRTAALEDINFSVEEGEFCILLGPSGCGKSTLLRIIAGIEEPSEGEVSIGSRNLTNLPPKEMDVAMVFQSYALYPHMTVRENLAFPLKVRAVKGKEMEDSVNEAAEILSIGELLGRYPRELSGGQRQRVAIGRAIVRKPKLFLFDEPLSNLDARLRVKMRAELAALHKRLKATIVYVTHDQTEAMTLGDRVVVMNEGKVQQIGSPSEVYDSPRNLFVAQFIGSPEMNIMEGRIEAGGFFRSGGLSFRLSSPSTDGEAAAGIRPEDLFLNKGEGLEEAGKANIELIENLGPEMIIYLNISGRDLVMRSEPIKGLSEGDDRMVYVKSGKVHMFREGRRI